ncbi:hypothetical protein FN976_03500 [Caenimonas sedimenti]|uniref:Autotransporter outer membrane beta-barrel domain-containing protein n=1 Tax=Caenimonas sedimenti TaxID=2596921 RepID=A0A562ZVK5_9BURK|nr:hypothetical protein [Caenimonas sedimenti]TWO72610.1 hypothetical protein FN976_03500 [Caenimonas sedimenti]
MTKSGLCVRWLAALSLFLGLAACGGSEGSSGPGLVLKDGGLEPQTGVWWNPAESGSGFAVELQGDIVSLGAYMYEADGKAAWYVGPLPRQSDGSYRGNLTRYAGGQTLTGTYRAPSSSSTVATVTFTLSSTTAGSLRFDTATGQRTVPVQRFALSGSVASPSSVGLQGGLWWNEAESGRGFFLDIQGTTAAMSSYMYDATGQPTWYLAVGTMTNLSFTAALQSYQGGQALGGTYRAPQGAGSPGTITFRGITGTTAELTLPDGRVIPLKRLVFATPAGGGSTSTLKLDGAYEGTVVNGTDPVKVTALALENDEIWLAYGTGATSLTLLEGTVVASGSSGNGSYSGSVLDLPGDEHSNTGSVTATYVNRSSLNGQILITGQTGAGVLSATGVPVARYNYDQAASLATISGGWPFTSTLGESGTLTVAADGATTVVLPNCTLVGTIVPRPSGKNVFNISLTVPNPTEHCSLPLSGVAYSTLDTSGNTLLWVGLKNAAQSEGGTLRGQR